MQSVHPQIDGRHQGDAVDADGGFRDGIWEEILVIKTDNGTVIALNAHRGFAFDLKGKAILTDVKGLTL